MPIEFDCPHCGAALSLWDELAGKQGSCPRCKESIIVPGGPASAGGVTMECPKCEADIPADSVICTHCGADLKHGAKLQTQINEPGAMEKIASESASEVLGLLWRYKFLIGAVLAFFLLMITLFSLVSKHSVEPGRQYLEDEKPAATRESD